MLGAHSAGCVQADGRMRARALSRQIFAASRGSYCCDAQPCQRVHRVCEQAKNDSISDVLAYHLGFSMRM